MKEPSITLQSVLLLVGAGQGLFFALVLLGMKTGNRWANRFLAAFLLVLSAGLIDGFMSVTYYYLHYPYLIGLQWPLTFAPGPLAYLYVRALTTPQNRIAPWKIATHFLPATLFSIRLFPFFIMDSQLKANQWFFENSDYQNYSTVLDPILYIIILQIVIYLFLSWRLLDSHAKRVQQNFSSVESINLSWLRTVILVFFCILIVWVFFAIFSQFLGVYKQSEYLFNFVNAVAIFVMGYKGIRQPEIFAAPVAQVDGVTAGDLSDGKTEQQETSSEDPGKYAKSSLAKEQSQVILSRLIQLMDREKPYLEMELTLPALSKMLSIYPHHLSQILNEESGRNFFDFVNSYRVEEAKKALLSPASAHLSILGIAMDAGFNSKSSFYTAFKKHTGMTPTQFKKRPPSKQPAIRDS